MLPSTTVLHSNKLLMSLPNPVRIEVTKYLDFVPVRAGQILSPYGSKIYSVYFPTTAVLCMSSLLETGGVLDVSTIGNDGTTGALAASGMLINPYAYMVQLSGHTYRMASVDFQFLLNTSLEFKKACLLYFNYLYIQTAQNAVCIKHHLLRERVCRWLMERADLSGNNTVVATQQGVADSLGCRREGITEVMNYLTDNKIVNHTRGAVEIIDWKIMRNQTCVCYPILRTAMNQMFPNQYKEEVTY